MIQKLREIGGRLAGPLVDGPYGVASEEGLRGCVDVLIAQWLQAAIRLEIKAKTEAVE